MSQNGTYNGAGTVDTLTGSDSADTFLLGDARGVFYDDQSNKPGGGELDYALIIGFNEDQDTLGLLSSSAYIGTLGEFGNDGNRDDTFIYLDVWKSGTDDRDELIAVVEGVDLTNVSGGIVGTSITPMDDFAIA